MKGPLDYYKEYLSNLDIYHQGELQSVNQNITQMKRGLDTIKTYSSEGYTPNGLEFSNMNKTQSLMNNVVQQSTIDKGSPGFEKFEKLVTEFDKSREQCDFSKVSEMAGKISSNADSIHLDEIDSLKNRQKMRLQYDPDSLTPNSNYLNSIDQSIDIDKINSKDFLQKNLDDQLSLNDLHSRVSNLDHTSDLKSIEKLSSEYSNYQISVKSDVSKVNSSSNLSDISKRQSLVDFLSYPSTNDSSLLKSKELSPVDKSIFKNSLLIEKLGQVKTDDSKSNILKKINDYNDRQSKNIPIGIKLDNFKPMDHLSTLEDLSEDEQKKAAFGDFKKTISSWKDLDTKHLSSKLSRSIESKKSIFIAESSKEELISTSQLKKSLDAGSNSSFAEDFDNKKKILSMSLSKLPSYKTRSLQTHYINSVSSITPTIVTANLSKGNSELGVIILQLVKSFEAKFNELYSLGNSVKNTTSLSDVDVVKEFGKRIKESQKVLFMLDKKIPLAISSQDKIMCNLNKIHDELCLMPQKGSSIDIKELHDQISQARYSLKPLPDHNQSFHGSSYYSDNLGQTKLSDTNLFQEERIKATTSLNQLKKISQDIPNSSGIKVKIATGLCDEASENLRVLNKSLSNMTSLAEKAVPTTPDFHSINELLDSKNSISNTTLLKDHLNKLKKTNSNLLSNLSYDVPTPISHKSLPIIPSDHFYLMKKLSKCLDRILSKDHKDVLYRNTSQLEGLNAELKSKILYQEDTIKSSQGNLRQHSEGTSPDLQTIFKNSEKNSGLEDVFPENKELLTQLQSCKNSPDLKNRVSEVKYNISNLSQAINKNQANFKKLDSDLKTTQDKIKEIKSKIQEEKEKSSIVQNHSDSIKYEKANIVLNELEVELSNNQALNTANAGELSVANASASTSMATCMSSQIMCTFGMGPSTYNSIRPTVLISNKPAANIMDCAPAVNFSPFPGCLAVTNPAWNPYKPISPCIPSASFIPTNVTTMLQGSPINNFNNKAMCQTAVGGVISFINPSQMTTMTS